MIDLTAGTSDAELTFWMHAYGSGIGTLRVGASTSATGPFTGALLLEWTISKPIMILWYKLVLIWHLMLGQMVYVSFTYERGTLVLSYQGDLAIDLMQVNSCLTVLLHLDLTS